MNLLSRMNKMSDAPYKIEPPVSRELYEENMRNRMAFRPPEAKVPSALDVQVAGDHYKNMVIQPVEYIHRNGIGFCEGSIIKYVSRWRGKNGLQDLKKARHFLDLLIEMESGETK